MSQAGSTGMATVLDVARLAGVSMATAARALGGYGSVSEDTRGRVRVAAAELGYRPNGLARSMITGLTHSIGVVLADIENPFFYGVLQGITDTARRRGFDLLLANTDEDPENERAAIAALVERRVEGLVLCTADGQSTEHLRALIGSGMPTVLLDRPIRGLKVDSVGLDNRAAAKEVTSFLLGLGHQRIAIVTGGPSEIQPRLRRPGMKGVERLGNTTFPLRAAGFRDAMLAAGVQPEAEYLVANGFHRADAEQATYTLMALPEPPTAIIAFDSVLALVVILAVRRLGLRCPDDLSVVGFDDAEWAEVVSPPLTVVRQPVYDIGVQACQLLLDRTRSPERALSRRRLQGTLIERGSTARWSGS